MRIKKWLFMLCMAIAMTIVVPTVTVDNISTVEAASKVKLNKSKVTLYEGKTTTLKVKGTKKKVKWSSSKKSVATVSSKGKVKAKKKGTATITAKVGNKKYKCKVTVKAKKKAESVPAFSVNTQDITIKDSGTIYVTFNDAKASVSGKVSDNGVISVAWNPTYKVGNTLALDIVALKNGVAYIELTNNVDSTKITIKVTVSGHVEPIEYISDRSVDYDSIEKEQRLFFAFKTANQTRVSASGVANIKIVNDDGVEVYNKAVLFNQNNFGNWTWAQSGTKYVCCIEIPDTELIKSTSTSGKLTFSVKLNDGTSFSESTYNVNNLPLQDLKEICRVTLSQVPLNISYYSYSGKLYSTTQITNVDYSVEKTYNGTYKATISIDGQKLYDYQGNSYSDSCKIGWKLYNGDVVVDSGTIYTAQIAVGEKFAKETVSIYNLEEGDYRLEFLDVR